MTEPYEYRPTRERQPLQDLDNAPGYAAIIAAVGFAAVMLVIAAACAFFLGELP